MKNLLKALLFVTVGVAYSQTPGVPIYGPIGSSGSGFALINSPAVVFATDADHTMVYPEMSGSSGVIVLTSTVPLTATRNLILPLAKGFQFTIVNDTMGGQSIQPKGFTGAFPSAIPNCSVSLSTCAMTVASDGTNIVQVGSNGSGSSVVINVATYGAKCDGATDDSTAVNDAITALQSLGGFSGQQGSIYLPSGVCYAPSISNSAGGVLFSGPGVLGKTISQTETGFPNATLGMNMSSSYAYKNRLVFGMEYMEAYNKAVVANIPIQTSTFSLTFSGDSTTAGTNVDANYQVASMVQNASQNIGIKGLSTVNAGHSGDNSGQLVSTYCAEDEAASPTPVLIQLRWGINDPSAGITASQTVANIRTCLAYDRSLHPVTAQTLIVAMPSATNIYPQGSDPFYYEQLRNGLQQAARDYQAVFIDNYGLMPDNDFAQSTIMMTNDWPGTPNGYTHPGDAKAWFYNDLLFDILFKPYADDFGYGVQNLNGITVKVTDAPQSYPLGVSTAYGYTSSPYDWPFAGLVTTIQGEGNGSLVSQTLCAYSSSISQCAYRGASNSTTWNPWVYLTPNQTGINPCFVYTDTTSNSIVSFNNYGTGTQTGMNLQVNRDCVGNILTPSIANAAIRVFPGTGSGNSGVEFFTGGPLNTLNPERFYFGLGASFGLDNINRESIDPGDGHLLVDAINFHDGTVQTTAAQPISIPSTTDLIAGNGTGGVSDSGVSVPSSGDILVGALFANQILGVGTNPTMVAGGGAGEDSNCTSITGNDMSGVISCTTGTAPGDGVLATITFSSPKNTAPYGCHLQPTNAAASAAATAIDSVTSQDGWVINVVNGSGLPASTLHTWAYFCI